MGISSAWGRGQTFTAGLSGQLLSVEFGFTTMTTGPFYPTTVQIQTVSGGLPTGTVLGSVYRPTGFGYGMYPIDLSSLGISVTAGSEYAILLSNDESPLLMPSDAFEVRWWAPGFDPDPYPNGQLLTNEGSGWQVLNGMFGAADARFATWVDPAAAPAAVPVPGAHYCSAPSAPAWPPVSVAAKRCSPT